MHRLPIAVAVLAASLLLMRAGAPAAQGLTVAAAASLQAALREVEPAFRADGHPAPTLVFGASGSLARQIENGAPYDLFASADTVTVERLAAEGLLVAGSLRAYAQGRLALAVAEPGLLRDAPPVLDGPTLARLRLAGVRAIAIANPAYAPYGVAAREALQAAGLWEALQPRLVYGDNVRQALTYVDTGNAEAGLVAASLLVGTERTWRPVDGALHRPIRQSLGIVAASPRRTDAEAFAAFLLGPRGQAILGRHGLQPPPP